MNKQDVRKLVLKEIMELTNVMEHPSELASLYDRAEFELGCLERTEAQGPPVADNEDHSCGACGARVGHMHTDECENYAYYRKQS